MAALVLTIMFVVSVTGHEAAQAQTFTVLHTFTYGLDGASPYSGLAIDKAGNLYGTNTQGDGGQDEGTVYKLKRSGSSWVFSPLFSFTGQTDGAVPEAGVIFGPNGTLYGTTQEGGVNGNGTVFNLKPSASACRSALCPWTETVLYRFAGRPDGADPGYGDVIFGQTGNIYGTTISGGDNNLGTVYQLAPSGNGWTESVLYSFAGPADGAAPNHGVILDKAGNLYGTTVVGGSSNSGTVFELSPAGSGWGEKVIYSFQGASDGSNPTAGLIFDQSGNLYGATSYGGQGGHDGGTVFELSPFGGGWTFSLLYSFTQGVGDDCGPYGTLVMDGAGNLYGTTACDGIYNHGSVFKLTHSGGSWTYTSLHDFTGGSDGNLPFCNVIFDGNGNLYGTALGGGIEFGVVWEITP
jgi:uncharacterized repeat protein (TIGR03803 family)